jgi:hypothetical protein
MSPVEHLVGFSIPNEAALLAAARCAPLLEVGAGTGYWASLLRERGVDILAYDSEPPTANMNNRWFGQGTYTEVRRGRAADLFAAADAAARALAKRALLVIWPNNPDAADNPHLVVRGVPAFPLWDAECVEAYLDAGGCTVIYVGEREATLPLASGARPDCGVSSSRAFQRILSERFELTERVRLPSWWMQADELTVWRRKT